MTATTVETKQLIPLLGMMWRGMWGATLATSIVETLEAAEDQPES